ncbi:MAG TPA: PAS domain-containing protein, partial [Ohtaekwangia sp.]|nr:PAS domain-containing protein [Ohtaekwangia sp.]
ELERQMHSIQQVKNDLEIREQVFGLTTILSESDIYGTIILINDKLCSVSGYSREELIGKPHNIFRHPDMPRELFARFWDTIKKGNVFQGIIKNRCKDGSHYWVDATIMPVKDSDGKITKYIGARYHIQDDAYALAMYNAQAKAFGLPLLQDDAVAVK